MYVATTTVAIGASKVATTAALPAQHPMHEQLCWCPGDESCPEAGAAPT